MADSYDTDHKIRVVTEWAGMWKQGQKCPNRYWLEGKFRCLLHTDRGGFGLSAGHIIPPPDLLAPAGALALLVALYAKGHFIEFDPQGKVQIYDPSRDRNGVVLDPDDLDAALLDAAYQLAAKEQR